MLQTGKIVKVEMVIKDENGQELNDDDAEVND